MLKQKNMKLFNKITSYSLLAVAALTVTSCNKIKDFGDTNVNPQEIATLSTSAVISNAQLGLIGWANSSRGGMYCQYFSEAEYPSTSRYSIPQLSFGGNYSGTLRGLQTVIQKSVNPNEVAVARILSQYLYWNMTDVWGDIPYSQAMQGSTVIPAYDKQEDIYKAMIAELKAATAGFTSSQILNGDLYYGSDATNQIARWKKFANSMRLLMALRLSKKYPTASDYAATQFKDALAAGVMESNDDNCKLVYPGGTYRNPYFETHLTARDLGESKTLVDLLSAYGDARQGAFGTSSTGVPYGWSEGNINTWREANPGWSRAFSDNYRTETYPITIMNAAEVFLARAEAADRGWTAENTSAMFTTGVTASFTRWGFAAPSAAYFAQTVNVLGATGTNLKQIATQRYFATYPNGLQGWSEWRRTGYPVLIPAVAPLTTSHSAIPTRYTYATDEYTLNPAGVAAAVTRIPGALDVQEGKVWWNQ
jgi:Starch-binding associating with outer membrane